MFNRKFLNMSFRLIKHLILAGIYLTCKCMSQQIENNTLIYGHDEIRRMNFYCQFASTEELLKIQPQMKCFANNREMQHILADGTKTFPYAPHGSTVGFILKCGDIPDGKLQPNCNRYVYTNCSYTCGTSDVVHTATCNLLGPWDNVSSQWSLTEPCAAANSVPNTSSRSPTTSSTSEPEIEVTATSTAVSFQSNVSSVNGTASVAFSSGGKSEDMTPVAIALVLAGLIVVVVLLVSIVVYVYKHKRRNTQQLSGPAHQEQCNGHSQNHVELEQEPSAVDSTIQQSLCVPLLAEGEGFAELPDWQSRPDYNYAENNNKCKGMGDKNPLEVLDICSKLDFASLDRIFVADIQSGIVNYSRAQNGFVQDMPATAGNVSNTQNGFVQDMPGTAGNVSNTQNGLVADLEMCNATVGLLKEQTTSYRKWLRAELEVISGRSRERALIGYVEENARALGYMPNEIKLLEKSYETQVDQKVSDEFLHKLAAYGVKLGSIVRYFYLHGNSEAITAILEVHRDCRFCEKFKRL